MRLLVSVTDYELRAGIGTLPAARDTLESAIRAAQLRVEQAIGTQLLLKTGNLDVFLLDPTVTAGVVPNGMFRLRLRNSLVRTVPAVEVLCGDDVVDPLQFTEVVEGYKLDADRGYVHVPDVYEGRYVTVGYDSGVGDSEAPPDNVAEAIVGYVPVVVEFSRPKDGESGSRESLAMAADHAMSVLGPYLRNLGLSLSPVY